jgi:predicted membrane protein
MRIAYAFGAYIGALLVWGVIAWIVVGIGKRSFSYEDVFSKRVKLAVHGIAFANAVISALTYGV